MKPPTRKARRASPLAVLALAAGTLALLRKIRKPAAVPTAPPLPAGQVDALVIGTGFGGSMAGLTVARAMRARGRGERILMLERGTWWTTPVNTVEDKSGAVVDLLRRNGQPVQFWNSVDNFTGLIDLVMRCVRRPGNEDGLFAQVVFGRKGAVGLAENDGVTVVGGNGVGGGSLVYSNVTLAPPDFVLDDPSWPVQWNGQREAWFDLARAAIGQGVLYAWDQREQKPEPALRSGMGLTNIAARAARLNPHWPHDEHGRPVHRLDLSASRASTPDPDHALWLDRARVFQRAVSSLTADFGTVDSAINDLPLDPEPFNADTPPGNYCERQGRCVLGCLPDARQTLSKQLMAAAFGTPALPNRPARPPLLPNLSIETQAEVESIRALAGGGYEVVYRRRAAGGFTRRTIQARVVIVAAGCTSTNEILLRSRAAGGLPYLSEQLGAGFSTNGDSLQFLDDTRERTYLTRGPMMTSYGRFHTPAAQDGADPWRYHALEDNGFPKVFANLVGIGTPLLRGFTKGRNRQAKTFLSQATALWLARKVVPKAARAALPPGTQNRGLFRSEDELLANRMCVATMGRDQADGRFRLGDAASGETALRVSRPGGRGFHEDPIYTEIAATLDRLAEALTGKPGARFQNPFFDLGRGKHALVAPVPLTHPLGGCRMASSAEGGVVDEFGRVFDASRPGGVYPGLYITDAAVIPTSLGINPTLTIAALALRSAQQLVQDWFPVEE